MGLLRVTRLRPASDQPGRVDVRVRGADGLRLYPRPAVLHPVADVDHGDVADQVGLGNDHPLDAGSEQLFEPGSQLHLIGDRLVQGDRLLAVPREESGVIGHEHHDQDQGAGHRGHPEWFRPQPADQPQGERGEVVSDLLLGQLGGAQPDDRQHAEQAQSEPGCDGCTGEHRGHREHAGVQRHVGDQHVATAVAGEVDPVGQNGDGHHVEGQDQYGAHRSFSSAWSLRPSTLVGADEAVLS